MWQGDEFPGDYYLLETLHQNAMPTLDWLAQVLHGRRPARAAGPGCRAADGTMGPGPAAGRGLFPDGGGRGNGAERAGKNDIWAGPAGAVDYAGPGPVLQLPERARHGFGRAGGGLGLFGGEPPGPVAGVGAGRGSCWAWTGAACAQACISPPMCWPAGWALLFSSYRGELRAWGWQVARVWRFRSHP